jgi:hypothetical protein
LSTPRRATGGGENGSALAEIIARAHEGNPTGQDEFIHLISDDADEDDDKPTGDETIPERPQDIPVDPILLRQAPC